MGRQKGQVMVMTILIMTIGCIWFALALTVSSNYFRVSHDEITIVQNRALAQGAMEEAMVILERAAAEDSLAMLPSEVINHQVTIGESEGQLTASWRQTKEKELTITASGTMERGKSSLTGDFVVVELPQSAGTERPILLVESGKFKTLLANNGYDHLLKDDHAGGLTLNQTEPLSGGLYCLGDGQKDWTVTVRSLTLDEGPLYVQGHLCVSGNLTVPLLWVTGNVLIEEGGSLSCTELWMGGEFLTGEALETSCLLSDAPMMKNVLVLRQMHP